MQRIIGLLNLCFYYKKRAGLYMELPAVFLSVCFYTINQTIT